MTKVVHDLRTPRREPVRWRRWAVRGGIAAVILITAGTAVMVESRSPVRADTLRAPARATRPVAAVPAPTPAVTDSSAGGLGVAPDSAGVAATDSLAEAAPDSLTASAPIVFDSARAQARRDSVRRYLMAAAAARARADSAAALRRAEFPSIRRAEAPERREAPAAPRRPIRADPQDLMMLSDSLSSAPSDTGAAEPPSLPQPNAAP